MVIKALLVAVVYYILVLLQKFFANSMTDRPIVIGPAVGLVLGDPVTGTLIGAQLEVIYLGVVSVGGAQATDAMYATAMAAALAIMTGMPSEAAIAIAIPLGFIGLFLLQVTRLFFAAMCPTLDRLAVNDREKAYCTVYIVEMLVGYALAPITVFIALSAGAQATQAFIDSLPTFIMTGMQAAGGMLPALGLGILMSMIWDNRMAVYFMLGFACVIYLNLPMVGLAIVAAFLTLVDYFRNRELNDLKHKLKNQSATAGETDEEEDFFA